MTRFVILLPGCCKCECVFIASKHSHLIDFVVKAGLHHGREVLGQLAIATSGI
ncbi:MAG: hypothetical protein RMY29_025940 [Nostoc sp. CreGUA01]